MVQRFTKAMIQFGYKQSHGNRTPFVKHLSKGKITILLVYVDDIIVTLSDEEKKLRLKTQLTQEFKMKEVGKLKYFLKIEVAYSKQGIFISQQKYILDLLKETGSLGCKPMSAPIDSNHRMNQDSKDGIIINKGRYQRLVGRLIYLSHTKPIIVYAVGVVSQFMYDPKEEHL